MTDAINLNESILDDVKKIIGLAPEITDFDQDLILHINSILAVLTQIGIGPSEGFFITCNTEKWSDFLGSGTELNYIKSYVAMRVRLIFDPPTNSNVTQALEKYCSEFETRAHYVRELNKDN